MKNLPLQGLFLFLVLTGFGCAKTLPKRAISSSELPGGLQVKLSQNAQFYHGNAGIIDLIIPDHIKIIEESLQAESIIELTDGEIKTIIFPFYKISDGHFQAILGVPYRSKIGQAEIKILLKTEDDTLEITQNFQVKPFAYGKDKPLSVDPNTVKPDPATQVIIEEQQKKLDSIYSTPAPAKLWQAPFKAPVLNPVETSKYGNARVYNGELKSFHSGLDYRANESTDLFATNNGIIVLAEPLHFTGNTIIIDHGKGLFTIYGHMSKFNSKIVVGGPIKKGQLLGRAGRTGRVTGPHLHWGLKIHGELVNPRFLYQLK